MAIEARLPSGFWSGIQDHDSDLLHAPVASEPVTLENALLAHFGEVRPFELFELLDGLNHL
jgi:hypothetical protein